MKTCLRYDLTSPYVFLLLSSVRYNADLTSLHYFPKNTIFERKGFILY